MRLFFALFALLVLPQLGGCCCIPFETAEQRARRREELDKQLREATERLEARKSEPASPVSTDESVGDDPAPDSLIAPYWGAMPEDERKKYTTLLADLDLLLNTSAEPDIVIYESERSDVIGMYTIFVENRSGKTLSSVAATVEFKFSDGTTMDTVGVADDSSLDPGGRTKINFFFGNNDPVSYSVRMQELGLFGRRLDVEFSDDNTRQTRIDEVRKKLERARSGMSVAGPEDKRINETDEVYQARKRAEVDAMHAREVAAAEREYQERIAREKAEAEEAVARVAEIADLEKQLADAIVLVRTSATPTELQATFSSRSSRPLVGVVFTAKLGDETADSSPTDVSQTKAVTVAFKLSNAEKATFTATVDGETRGVMSRDEYEAAKARLEKLKAECLSE